jgi:5-methylcytosine-specific restriction protein A
VTWSDNRTVSPRNQTRPADWKARKAKVIERDGGLCYRCGLGDADQVDHVIPVSQGGDHEPGNLKAAHLSCVRRKNAAEASKARRKHRIRRDPEKHPGLID